MYTFNIKKYNVDNIKKLHIYKKVFQMQHHIMLVMYKRKNLIQNLKFVLRNCLILNFQVEQCPSRPLHKTRPTYLNRVPINFSHSYFTRKKKLPDYNRNSVFHPWVARFTDTAQTEPGPESKFFVYSRL